VYLLQLVKLAAGEPLSVAKIVARGCGGSPFAGCCRSGFVLVAWLLYFHAFFALPPGIAPSAWRLDDGAARFDGRLGDRSLLRRRCAANNRHEYRSSP
jgi:hypothetical protein